MSDAKLFTPGPLSTSATVKHSQLVDLGSRDSRFLATVREIRSDLLKVGGCTDDYTAVPMQGSGTFAIESVLTTVLGKTDGKALILSNGAYGNRVREICETAGIRHKFMAFEETNFIDIEAIETELSANGSQYALMTVVHCETSTGVINPIEKLSVLLKRYTNGCLLFVDAMSSFGGIPLNIPQCHIDFLVSSANKCLQGVPGFSYAICRLEALKKLKGNSRSFSLDLYAQWEGLEKSGQFRFTPPTHAMLAFKTALDEFWTEGGVEGRYKRYVENNRGLREGMKQLGFKTLLNDTVHTGAIITSFLYPTDSEFHFENFYSALSKRGLVIYPGKVSKADSFRIGNIGHLFSVDFDVLCQAVEEVLVQMGVKVPVVY